MAAAVERIEVENLAGAPREQVAFVRRLREVRLDAIERELHVVIPVVNEDVRELTNERIEPDVFAFESMMFFSIALPGPQVASMYGILGMKGMREYSVATGRRLKRTRTYQGSFGGAEYGPSP